MEKENARAPVLNAGVHDALSRLDHESFIKLLSDKHTLPALKEFLTKCISRVSFLVIEESKAQAAESSSASGDVYYKFEQTQLIEPRGMQFICDRLLTNVPMYTI